MGDKQTSAEVAMTVLVVEDEPLIRMGISCVLKELGHNVLEASTGSDALKILHGNSEIDLLLTDFRMPGICGLDLATKSKAIRPNLRIVLMTGYSSIDHIFPVDCPRRLEKPFSVSELTKVLACV